MNTSRAAYFLLISGAQVEFLKLVSRYETKCYRKCKYIALTDMLTPTETHAHMHTHRVAPP